MTGTPVAAIRAKTEYPPVYAALPLYPMCSNKPERTMTRNKQVKVPNHNDLVSGYLPRCSSLFAFFLAGVQRQSILSTH